MTKKILGVFVIAFFMAAFVLFAEDAPLAPSPDAKGDNFLLAADFRNAFAEYRKLLLENVNSPLSEYYFAKCVSVMGSSGGAINPEQLLDIEKINPKNAILAANLLRLKTGSFLKQGRVADAERVADEMGFVKDWLIIGPFDNATKAGYKKVFPPETEFHTDKTYEGKNGKNTWRQLSVRPPFGTIYFSNLFRADSYVAAYAAVFIRAEKEQPVAFRTCSSGPLKIWLNDRLIAGIEAYRECDFDQDCTAGRLKPGWNKLLVKICQKDGEWEAALRITAPDGGRVEGIVLQNNIDIIKKEILPAYIPDDSDTQIDADSGAVGYFSKLIENNPDDHFALAGLAFMYDFKKILDENDKTVSNNARKALEKNPGNDFYRYLAGTCDEDRNKRLEALLQLSGKNPPSAMALFKLSELYSSTGGGNSGRRRAVSANEAEDITKTFSVPMPFREEEFLNAALKQNPDFVQASLALVGIYNRRGTPWSLEAEKISKRLLTLAPENPVIVRLTYDDDLHTTAENAGHYAKLLAVDYTDGNARNYCIYYLKQAGRKDEVLKEYRAFLQLNPFASSIYQRMADYYEGCDEYEESIACLNKALETNPEDIAAFEELGNYYLILKDIPKAQENWEKALAVKPNLPDITEHLEALKPKEKKFWEGIAANPVVYAAEALADTEVPLHASAVNCLKNEIIKINPNGTSSTFSQQVVKVFDEKASMNINTYP
ncbi:MAG: hypothetical protein HZA48_12515 [Planctomycetes bacterium]|nr:hypothetical protein [Planctomycetota bacterium]